MQNYPDSMTQDERAIREFASSIERLELPGEQFDHLGHVRLACFYFLDQGLIEGQQTLFKVIETYARSLGATDKFHATITDAYYRLVVNAVVNNQVTISEISEHLVQQIADQTSLELVKEYYSEFLLQSPSAKQNVLMADRKPLMVEPLIEGAEYLNSSFQYHEGHIPLLISMPHNGTCIPEDIAQTMTSEALTVPDTDWYLRQLYDFAIGLGCHVLVPRYSRYVIDLNRPEDDAELYPGANNTELCPSSLFNLNPMYQSGEKVGLEEQRRRIELYWRPYHQQLQKVLGELQKNHPQVLLFEAHSIASQVPRFFEGQLPDFNFGTNQGASCVESIGKYVEAFDTQSYSKVINGRFKGGYITRAYCEPSKGVSSLQLELSQRTYLNEEHLSYDTEKAQEVQKVLQNLIKGLISTLVA